MNAFKHDPRRRALLTAGGGLLMCAAVGRRSAASDEITISMAGTPTGAHVWFRPRGVLIRVGQTVRWVNQDVGNVHTVTAYHPDNKKPLRIPDPALSWNSNYLMPNDSFTWVFDVPGVYDYFCIPHEQAGMVGRIVVGDADVALHPYEDTDKLLSAKALAGFPGVDKIVEQTVVE